MNGEIITVTFTACGKEIDMSNEASETLGIYNVISAQEAELCRTLGVAEVGYIKAGWGGDVAAYRREYAERRRVKLARKALTKEEREIALNLGLDPQMVLAHKQRRLAQEGE